MLSREEYIEQAYFFRMLSERLPENIPLQDLLGALSDEVLATTKLPLAIRFLLTELNHGGSMAPAMRRLPHYFTAYQAYLVDEAESERGRFDMRTAVAILQREAEYRTASPSRPGMFFYQFESICRNRLKYGPGLLAISQDPFYDEAWRGWILEVRKNIGILELPDMVYVNSENYRTRHADDPEEENPRQLLFGDGEGRIAVANRKKDPLFFFAALQRHLNYPAPPRPKPRDETKELIPQLIRRLERLETRLKMVEDENRDGAINLDHLMRRPDDK
ncbi:hypothetical protein [Lignipirellula cremea]|uniref:Uncharacterized protein n=1 Tax=Lignipirellula cremea TaxID=2528010 RepID=A0A518DYI8_9BACT|nr:hypothetical protein [Lignipirellula cremea]QDU96894.1 hypothetical protein Pla8534_47160 [Lignipirellula cremea]